MYVDHSAYREVCIVGWNPTQGETLVVLGATPIAQCLHMKSMCIALLAIENNKKEITLHQVHTRHKQHTCT